MSLGSSNPDPAVIFFLGAQVEGASSFLAMLASSSSEEMEAELKERVESSCKQASCVVEICESLKSTVEQLKKDLDCNSGTVHHRTTHFSLYTLFKKQNKKNPTNEHS